MLLLSCYFLFCFTESFISVYAVAANAIQIKIGDSEDEGSVTSSVVPKVTGEPNNQLQVTQTGILSNRRPTAVPKSRLSDETPYGLGQGSSVSSGTSFDLLALARKEAAKRELYSRFHRGAVLHNHHEDPVTGEEEQGTQGTVPEYSEKRRRREEKRLAKAERRKRKQPLASVHDLEREGVGEDLLHRHSLFRQGDS